MLPTSRITLTTEQLMIKQPTMTNYFWHYKVTNKISFVEFRTTVSRTNKEEADKRAAKNFPSQVYSLSFIGRTTQELANNLGNDLLEEIYTTLHPAAVSNPFPVNPGLSLIMMEIGWDLENIHGAGFIQRWIAAGLKEGKVRLTIETIYEQSRDNRAAMAEVIGETILRKIEKLYL